MPILLKAMLIAGGIAMGVIGYKAYKNAPEYHWRNTEVKTYTVCGKVYFHVSKMN